MPPKSTVKKDQAKGASLVSVEPREALAQESVLDDTQLGDLVTLLPQQCFPIWKEADLENEDWGSYEAPFEDPDGVVALPKYLQKKELFWKRPCEFREQVASEDVPEALVKGKSKSDKKINSKLSSFVGPRHGHIYVPEKKHFPSEMKEDGEEIPGKEKPLPEGSFPRFVCRDYHREWSDNQLVDFTRWEKEEERVALETAKLRQKMKAYEERQKRLQAAKDSSEMDEGDVDEEKVGKKSEKDEQEEEDDEEESSDEEDSSDDNVDDNDNDDDDVPPNKKILPNQVEKPVVPQGSTLDSIMASYFRTIASWAEWMTMETPFLWEAIYPQDHLGRPMYNPGGKYLVRLFVQGQWRKVTMDDRIPVDSTNTIQIASSSDLTELWPSLLAKALYKVLAWTQRFDDFPSQANVVVSRLSFAIGCLTGYPSHAISIVSMKEDHRKFLIDTVPDVTKTKSESEKMTTSDENENITTMEDMEEIITMETKERTVQKLIVLVGNQSLDESMDLTSRLGEALPVSSKRLNGNELVLQATGDRGDVALLYTDLAKSTWSQVVFYTERAVLHQDQWASECPIVEETSENNSEMDLENLGPKYTSPKKDSKFLVIDIPHDAALPVSVVLTLHVGQDMSLPVKQRGNGQLFLLASRDETLMSTKQVSLPQGTNDYFHKVLSGTSSFYKAQQQTMPSNVIELSSNFVETFVLQIQRHGRIIYALQPNHMPCGFVVSAGSTVPLSIYSQTACWREAQDLNVLECEGTYDFVPADKWTILFRSAVQIQLTEEECSDKAEVLLKFRLDMTDRTAAPMTSVYIINNDTGESFKQLELFGSVMLRASARGYTLLGAMHSKNQCMRKGSWVLGVASTAPFQGDFESLLFSRKTFQGAYYPNKELKLFRDIISIPSKSCGSFFFSNTFQLFFDHPKAAVKLEVRSKQNNRLLASAKGPGNCILFQLPSKYVEEELRDESEGKNEGSGTTDDVRMVEKDVVVSENGSYDYILEGYLDKAHCLVPSELQAITTPFYDPLDPTKQPNQLSSENEIFSTHDTKFHSTFSGQWTLEMLTHDANVQVTPDMTKTNDEVKIKASWEEKDPKRKTKAVLSRLLYLKGSEAAQVFLSSTEWTDDDKAAIHARMDAQQRLLGSFTPLLPAHVGQTTKLASPALVHDQPVLYDLRHPEDVEHRWRKIQQGQEFKDRLLQRRERDKETRLDEQNAFYAQLKSWREKIVTERSELWTQREQLRQTLK